MVRSQQRCTCDLLTVHSWLDGSLCSCIAPAVWGFPGWCTCRYFPGWCTCRVSWFRARVGFPGFVYMSGFLCSCLCILLQSGNWASDRLKCRHRVRRTYGQQWGRSNLRHAAILHKCAHAWLSTAGDHQVEPCRSSVGCIMACYAPILSPENASDFPIAVCQHCTEVATGGTLSTSSRHVLGAPPVS